MTYYIILTLSFYISVTGQLPPRGNCPGGNCPRGQLSGGNRPGGQLSRRQMSGGGQLSRGAIVLEPLKSAGFKDSLHQSKN